MAVKDLLLVMEKQGQACAECDAELAELATVDPDLLPPDIRAEYEAPGIFCLSAPPFMVHERAAGS